MKLPHILVWLLLLTACAEGELLPIQGQQKSAPEEETRTTTPASQESGNTAPASQPKIIEPEGASVTAEEALVTPPAPEIPLPSLPVLSRAPELQGLGTWFNSEPVTLENLRGKVVLIDFWTYSCINCIRTLPYLQGYWEKFQNQPFVLIGVHSPEFAFEKLERNVADAIERHGLTYPIAQDNDFKTWRAFENRYWPAKYLIDAEGFIRYRHFGEGAYEETDLAIQSLLAEIGVSAQGTSNQGTSNEQGARRTLTPETYLGARSWGSLGNGSLTPSDDVVSYAAPASLELHQYYLVGDWQLRDRERQVLMSSEGEIRMKFLGSEINLVLALEEGVTAPVAADVAVDGKHSKSFTIDRNDLQNLYKGTYGEHEVILRIHGKGVAGYAFTFGSS